MPIIVESVMTAEREKRPQPPLEPDDYLATFTGYVNIGATMETFQDQPAKEVNNVYCVFELKDEVDAFGKPRLLSIKLNLSLSALSKFRKFWSSVITDIPDCVAAKNYVETSVQNKYLGEFDRYLGMQLRLVIGSDKGYPVINSCMKLKSSQSAWENRIEPFFFDLKVKESLKNYPLLPSICRKDLAKSKVGLENTELIAKLEARLKEIYAEENAARQEKESQQPKKEEDVSDTFKKLAEQSISARAVEATPQQSDDLPF